MTTIGLIRHGITQWNNLGKAQGTSDIPLNELGRKQATNIGARLREEGKWDVIISSDLTRAIETAQIIGSKLNLPISHYDIRIREIDCGEIEGTTEEDRLEKWGSNWRDKDLGMESFEEVGKRGIEFIKDIVHTYNGKRILIVSHGALIGLTLQKLLPSRFQTTYIDNTSFTILENINGNWDCSLYNCSKHLM
ncbi:histidine phosphatase family protein [Pseudalkalibacillus hwajinpoensis]|uniref:Histidine phosphatase family protein n=1 Tax=Guptibacillus hwajinpoensis TaxID=208199 RepID=A0A4U1M859_9BACL|nr:histidine phosphatase family protein [Pseudalkalibacillus hwajinpoensis]TKD66462.1 histidine phosphatase family protein [Pseudalkalibacillus hwajinpoensis]